MSNTASTSILVSESGVSFENTAVAFSSKSDLELKKTYWLFKAMNAGWLVAIGTFFIDIGLKLKLPIRGALKQTLFQHFCGGETIDECTETMRELSKGSVRSILDYSVEGATSEKGFDQTTATIKATIEKAALSLDIAFSVFKCSGIVQPDLLEKVQAGASLSAKEKESYSRFKLRVDELCRTAYEKDVKIFIDAEESWIQEPIDALALEMMRKYNKEKAIVYNTYQLYLASKFKQLQLDYRDAIKEDYVLGAKLVRGAYMEKERERAKDKGYPNPIQPNKEACDTDYDNALKFCLSSIGKIHFCAGTHNEYSNYYLSVLMNKYKVMHNDERVFFSQLYGMSDHISFNLANAGFNVAKYVPFGPVEKVMPYLFRRAAENTSISGQSSRELTLISREVQRRKKKTKR